MGHRNIRCTDPMRDIDMDPQAHRNVVCTNQMMDIDMDQQGQVYHYRGPHIQIAAAPTIFQPPNVCTMVAASGSSANYEAQFLPERHDGQFYGTATHYNDGRHHHHPNVHGHYYYSFMPPSSSARVLPGPVNQGPVGHISSSSAYGVAENSGDQHAGPCKRKIPESVQGNSHASNSSATPSSFVAPLNMRHTNSGSSAPNPASFALPRYTVNGNPPIHDHRNHLARGNFVGPHFQPWNQAPGFHFMHGSAETGNRVTPRHYETVDTRNSQSVRHAPPVNNRNHNHHSSQPIQRYRGNNDLITTFRRSSLNSHNNNGTESSHRHAETAPPTGIRIYRPHRGGAADTTLRQQQLAQLRYLQTDEVAILEIPDYYEMHDFGDNHSDMRLDIEDMSYEELLALGERIGSVNTGLSEEKIAEQLKTVSYLSPRINMNVVQTECSDKDADSCIICQDNYKLFEKIGVLGCGHDYHAECLKKWLLIKNVCPICKCEALAS